MKVLAFETSTQQASVALRIDGQLIGEEISLLQRSHSEVVNAFAEKLVKTAQIEFSDIDVFATGQGPGSFTGIRVATNAAKSFAFAFNKPMVALDSLFLMAAKATPCPLPVLAMINAHKNMVYLGLFDCQQKEPRYLLGPSAISVRDLVDHIQQDVTVIGDGFTDYESYFPQELKQRLHRQKELPDHPHASILAELAEARLKNRQTLDWKSFTPLYIRASEAEESKRGIFIKPLTK